MCGTTGSNFYVTPSDHIWKSNHLRTLKRKQRSEIRRVQSPIPTTTPITTLTSYTYIISIHNPCYFQQLMTRVIKCLWRHFPPRHRMTSLFHFGFLSFTHFIFFIVFLMILCFFLFSVWTTSLILFYFFFHRPAPFFLPRSYIFACCGISVNNSPFPSPPRFTHIRPFSLWRHHYDV